MVSTLHGCRLFIMKAFMYILQIIVTLLEVLKVKNKKLMQTAWNYMNDSLRSEVFVRFDPETIACACIYLSARLLQFPLPNSPSWFLVFDVVEKDLADISLEILSLYSRKKPDPEKLEKKVDELKKAHLEAKLKARGLQAANNLLNSASSSQPNSPRNGTKSPASDRKKDKHNDVSPNNSRHHSTSHSDRSGSSGLSSHGDYPSKRTPPRSFKERRRSRSPVTNDSSKKSKRNRSRSKRKRSPSPAHPKKKSSSKSGREKSHRDRTRSRSPHDRANHEKSHKSKNRERTKENHHSRDKKRR